MIRGQRPKPAALRALQGNPGHRPLPDEPKVAPGLPEAPAALDAEGREEWYRVGALMLEAGMITRLDRGVLALYCAAWSRWIAADAEMRKEGLVIKTRTGYPIINPALTLTHQAALEVSRHAGDLGLSPSSRTRIRAADMRGTAEDPVTKFKQQRPGRPPMAQQGGG